MRREQFPRAWSRLTAGFSPEIHSTIANGLFRRADVKDGLPRFMRNLIAVRQLLAGDIGTFHSMPEDLWR